MTYLSVCSGIEAATVAWHPLGWTPVAFAEIDAFPSAVLVHHYPGVQNWGDLTRFQEWPDADVDVLVGGTPCQSFSVAGLRAGLDDPRGSLMLTYLAVARRYRPRWVVWENVPGVLSIDDGRAFGSLLGGLAELGYGFAYRILDAQYVGVPQRRRRVFVVGHLGDWRRAAAVLFERASLSGHPPPRREAREGVAASALRSTDGGSDVDHGRAHHIVSTLDASYGRLQGCSGQDALHGHSHLVPVAYGGNDTRGAIDVATAVNAHGGPHGRLDFESETFIAFAPDLADPLCANEQRTYTHEGTGNFRTRNVVAAYVNPRQLRNSESSNQVGIKLDADVADALCSDGPGAIAFDTTQITHPENRSNPKPDGPAPSLAKGAHPPAIAFSVKDHGADAGEIAPTLRAGGHDQSHANGGVMPAVAFQESQSGFRETDAHPTLDSHNGSRRHHGVAQGMHVRRLTPRECERLQGFPDDYTLIPYKGKPAKDGPRYKALGNSMAVPVMAWIGRRIQIVEDLA